MQYVSDPEYWLRGPVDQVPALLQPVAHALLQVRAEVNRGMENFPESKLWIRPGGLASPGFHLQHIPGVIDRLFTYAREEQLNEKQLQQLTAENKTGTASVQILLERLNSQTDQALDQLKQTDPEILTDTRYVGRKKIPSTVTGLLTHAAEHSMRHTGQLLVTIQLV